MSEASSEYSVRINDYGTQLPSVDENVDVEVTDSSGRRWSATFYSLANVDSLLRKWETTGEYGGGIYFFGGRDAIIVRELSHEVIRATVAQLVSDGDLDIVLQRLDEDDDEP